MSRSLCFPPASFQKQLTSWQHFDAFQSNLPSSCCASKPEPAPAKYPPSALHIHALLPTSSNGLLWPAAEAFSSHLSGKDISCQCFCRLRMSRCARKGHLTPRSRVSHITAPVGPLTCLHVCPSRTCFIQASLLRQGAQRRRRRGSVTTRKPHQYQCVQAHEGQSHQFNNAFHTRARVSSEHCKFSHNYQKTTRRHAGMEGHPLSTATPSPTPKL